MAIYVLQNSVHLIFQQPSSIYTCAGAAKVERDGGILFRTCQKWNMCTPKNELHFFEKGKQRREVTRDLPEINTRFYIHIWSASLESVYCTLDTSRKWIWSAPSDQQSRTKVYRKIHDTEEPQKSSSGTTNSTHQRKLLHGSRQQQQVSYTAESSQGQAELPTLVGQRWRSVHKWITSRCTQTKTGFKKRSEDFLKRIFDTQNSRSSFSKKFYKKLYIVGLWGEEIILQLPPPFPTSILQFIQVKLRLVGHIQTPQDCSEWGSLWHIGPSWDSLGLL